MQQLGGAAGGAAAATSKLGAAGAASAGVAVPADEAGTTAEEQEMAAWLSRWGMVPVANELAG